ncbi:MAG TPA: SpoIID/LytB domain-containing protein [Pyrinomonadaceae bacterium]|nr:SpoIID/LytB domain-containing protein [Pyrinomonadaceae bacterium]
MRFPGPGIRQVNRVTREHGMLLAFAAAAILFLILTSSHSKPISFNWGDSSWGETSNRNEAQIDAALQEAAASALANRDGTIIVMDAQTGRVRALVNPQLAYTQASMPGSAMKPFTALAALRAGMIAESSHTVCPGRFTGLNFSLPCVHADHLPPFSTSQAIAYSCNYYFAAAGQRLGRDKLVATLREFNFGRATGISEAELSGVVRPCEIGNSARVRASEPTADESDCLERTAVGESKNIQVTPIQLLTAYAALINGGHLFKPQLAAADHFRPVERSNISIAAQHQAVIVEGMRGAISYGTARAAKLDSLPLTIIGKTGTAMPAKGFRNNGWFVGFAGPFQSSGELDPSRMDLAVLVLTPRAHGSDAAKLARPIFETYANEISHEDADTSSSSSSDAKSSDAGVAVSPRSADAASPIKVYLGREKVTQTLSLEDYVAGVLRAEGTVETEPEALKALAIAIRTYALKNIGRHATHGYDFCSTTHCQRFVGRDPSGVDSLTATTLLDRRVSAAVRTTEGQVLRDAHDQPIDAYYGASCGGETANIRHLWGARPEFYLRGVRDEFCDSGPHAKWTDALSRADLLRALQSDSRTDVGSRLDQIEVSKRDQTGRAEFITLAGERRKTVRGWDFKIIVGRALGWNVLKSSRFEIARSGSNFVFRGSGFGHGLGLCQEGAHVMAARGASYQKILEKYFPGTVVKRDVRKQGQGATATVNVAGESKADILLTTFAYKNSHPAGLTSNSRLLTIASEHFNLAYPAGVDRRTVNQILNTLELTRKDYLRRASSASTIVNIPPVGIRVNESTGDFTSRTGQPWWVAAATQGNRIELQPVAILKQRGVLFTTLRHELAHIIIESVSNKRAPRWLEEGFALYLAAEGRAISRYGARRRLAEDELEQRLQRHRTQEEMRTLYAEAYLMVAEMIRRQGEASVWNRLSRY